MRKGLFFVGVLGLFACSDEINMSMGDSLGEKRADKLHEHKIDKEKALEYASIYFNQVETRSSSPLIIDYIVDEVKTRNGIPVDTLAYIVNRGESDGFVIISSDDRVYPIIGYSPTGTMRYEEGSTADEFLIASIKNYVVNAQGDNSYVVSETDFENCYVMDPLVKTAWGQGEPYNKVVCDSLDVDSLTKSQMSSWDALVGDSSEDSIAVGCVALATAQIMTHCKLKINYNATPFHFNRIIKGLERGEGNSVTTRIVSADPVIDTDTVAYQYNVAMDSLSLLLYWIGKDVGMQYGKISEGGSWANSDNAMALLSSLGYKVRASHQPAYNMDSVIAHMQNNRMIYMRGHGCKFDENSTYLYDVGHAWIADGYQYCIEPTTKEKINSYVHCDWGWYGYCNGYFTTDIFFVDNNLFDDVRYFAVDREYIYKNGNWTTVSH